MESLLPSEIARLVLGYLEDQKCTEAARMFLETSPNLQECRTVHSRGRRFSTRVSGLTLIDLIEKFSAISTMIQERLNKVTDCEQLKHCGDLIEQLKFLVEEPRGQRFVVNINVPSQSSTQVSHGSPVITSSMRKRHHSNSERIKRTVRSQSNILQHSDSLMSPPSCDNINATPLESLPGNLDSLKQVEPIIATTEKGSDNVAQESHSQYGFDNDNINHTICNRDNSVRRSLDDVASIRSYETDIDDKQKEDATSTAPLKRCNTATSTEELMSFSSIEVQTAPYEMPESESESNDEPIENLSILTKEILNRTELQECIAENINKAILPTDISLRDESLNDSEGGGEGNTSIMAELNNAIKSIVEATESDPVFEKFLDEIIGPHTETDSPDEDSEGKPNTSPKSLNDMHEKQIETVLSNISSPEPTIADTKTPTENDIADVPLKHRLRSSSRQQNNRIEDEVDKARDQEKEQSALEDQNAAAVLSIINANITNTSNDKRNLDDVKELIEINDNNGQKPQTLISVINRDDTTLKSSMLSDIQKVNNVIPLANSNVESKTKKSAVKRPRPTKLKRDQTINNIKPMTEHDIMTMPTLVLCSKEEINNLLSINSTKTSASRFIPIAPKEPDGIKQSMETVYLRTVNVAQKLPVSKTLPSVIEASNDSAHQALLPQKKNYKANKRLKTIHKTEAETPIDVDQPISNPVESVETNKIVENDMITLYANEGNTTTSLNTTNMPPINIEENISLSESGLSPYLKFNCSRLNQNHNLSDIDITSTIENAKIVGTNNEVEEQQIATSKNTDCDIIAKRTPRSLLKSRSKNHRLSLSTPRRRSSHIRALDFSTPTKVINSTKTISKNEKNQFTSSEKHVKSVRRTSLFKSPSFSNSLTTPKQKSPVKICQPCKIPIATRSPAPKLMGGWDKYNGVGVIIGDVSSFENTNASCSEIKIQHKTSKTSMESWDADLRRSVQLDKKDVNETKKSMKKKNSTDNPITHKKNKLNSKLVKSRKKKKTCERSRECKQEMKDVNKLNEDSQQQCENKKIATVEKNRTTVVKDIQIQEKEHIGNDTICSIDANNSINDKTDKISESVNNRDSPPVSVANIVSSNNVVSEKKPIKKYVQLKTISTNIKKKKEEVNLQTPEFSKISDNAQHILRMPDMIDLDTPRKFNNISGVPATPRVLSPSSNIITPFIKVSEESTKLRSFVSTPEFPVTPCIALTPKLTEETTRDIIKKGDYNSPYYKPTSEQTEHIDKVSAKSKHSPTIQKSPIISSSHIKLHSMHNSLTSGNIYQTCTSSKLEITQFEVIKENLPKEEAIKELKIANNSKDSTSVTELSAPVIIDHHVDLIQINEYNGISKHCETIINDNYVVDFQNDNSTDSESSSSSDTSSSSSSSCTSTTSDTNSSEGCLPEKEDDEVPSKRSTDASDSAQKDVNKRESTNIIVNDTSANIETDEHKKLNNISSERESSPKKVFSITKTDDQINATLKETPAKNETLLIEADISETPSSSKNGVENLTNLSTKISAIITEDEKLSKLNKLSNDGDQIANKLKAKPKVINMEYIRSESSRAMESERQSKDKCHSDQEKMTPMYNELIVQLEEKRQRMIAKFKDIPKSNLSTRMKHKRILISKASNNLKKGNKLTRGKSKYVQSTVKHSLQKRINIDEYKNIDTQNKSPIKENSAVESRHEHKQNPTNNYCKNNEEHITKQLCASKSTDPNVANYINSNTNKPFDDSIAKEPHRNNICNKENNLMEDYKRELKDQTELHNNSSSDDQRCLKDKLDIKESVEKDCSSKDNFAKEEAMQTFRNDAKTSEKLINIDEKQIIVQKILVPGKSKQEIEDQTDDKINKLKSSINYNDKSKQLLKHKVDQVKRDLFSDEESDHKMSNTITKNNKTQKIINVETKNVDPVEISHMRESVSTENSKEGLSTVLQCLQLVPAHKNENVCDDEKQTAKQHQNLEEQHNGRIETDIKLNQEVDVHNYKAEYHFVYDDNVPVRKRRRRYSGHELQIEINHADLSDPNSIECIKIMKATEFEEIFNLPPKAKKRTLNKKSPTKNEKGCETYDFKTDNHLFSSKSYVIKPLATSSPVNRLAGSKVKKAIPKIVTINKTDQDTQSDVKKKQKLSENKSPDKESIIKNRKRKLSENKSTNEVEKKFCTTDPKKLLTNLDLDKFLTSVHGPE